MRTWLRTERQRVTWTQRELARRSGVPSWEMALVPCTGGTRSRASVLSRSRRSARLPYAQHFQRPFCPGRAGARPSRSSTSLHFSTAKTYPLTPTLLHGNSLDGASPSCGRDAIHICDLRLHLVIEPFAYLQWSHIRVIFCLMPRPLHPEVNLDSRTKSGV